MALRTFVIKPCRSAATLFEHGRIASGSQSAATLTGWAFVAIALLILPESASPGTAAQGQTAILQLHAHNASVGELLAAGAMLSATSSPVRDFDLSPRKVWRLAHGGS